MLREQLNCDIDNCTISFNNNNSVYNSSKFSVLTQQDRFYPMNESPLLYTHGGFSPIQPIEMKTHYTENHNTHARTHARTHTHTYTQTHTITHKHTHITQIMP